MNGGTQQVNLTIASLHCGFAQASGEAPAWPMMLPAAHLAHLSDPIPTSSHPPRMNPQQFPDHAEGPQGSAPLHLWLSAQTFLLFLPRVGYLVLPLVALQGTALWGVFP